MKYECVYRLTFTLNSVTTTTTQHTLGKVQSNI